uniref:Uncharacterized protein n=1 Tax=Oryza punctata TaxID=4537 RepID=A0A0E0JFY4_ORYPU
MVAGKGGRGCARTVTVAGTRKEQTRRPGSARETRNPGITTVLNASPQACSLLLANESQGFSSHFLAMAASRSAAGGGGGGDSPSIMFKNTKMRENFLATHKVTITLMVAKWTETLMMPSTDMIAAAHTSSAAAAIAPGCQFPSASCAAGRAMSKSNQETPARAEDARRRKQTAPWGRGWDTYRELGGHAERADGAAALGEGDARAGEGQRARRSEPSKATPASSSHFRAPVAIHAGGGAGLPPMRARDWFLAGERGGRRVDGFDWLRKTTPSVWHIPYLMSKDEKIHS